MSKIGRLGILFLLAVLLAPASLVLAEYRFDISPNGTVTDDTILNVYVKADFQARTWLDIRGTQRSDPHFNDFGGPEHTSTIKTNEWGLGTLTICSVAQRDGQSEQQAQSEERCQSVNVISSGNSSPGQSPQTGGADFTGFCKNSKNLDRVGGNPANAHDLFCAGGDQEVRFTVEEVCAWQYGGALPYPGLNNAGDRNSWTCNAQPTYVAPENTNSNSGSSNNNNNNSNSGNNNQNNQNQNNGGNSGSNNNSNADPSCGGGLVSVGDTAVVLPGDPNNIRSGPSKGSIYLTKMSQGSQFTVIGGPACSDGLRWWQVNFKGTIGWTAEGDGSTNWIQTVSRGSGSSGSSQPQGPSNSNAGQSTEAACNTRAPFAVGNLGKVLPGPKNNVRSSPSASASLSFQMEQNSVFTVIGGPQCAEGFRWWQISYNGQIGWTAEGNAAQNWVAYAGEGQSQSASSQNLIISVQVVDGSWFNFVYDSANELIVNGDEFTVNELQKLKNKLSGQNMDVQRTIFYFYAVPIGGDSNKNKDIVVNAVCKQSIHGFDSCKSRIRYSVGTKVMDLSGVGNIAYGYFMTDLGINIYWQNGIANTDQTLASLQAHEGWRFTDNPDDIAQRNVGLALSKLSLSISNLDDVARTQGLY